MARCSADFGEPLLREELLLETQRGLVESSTLVVGPGPDRRRPFHPHRP